MSKKLLPLTLLIFALLLAVLLPLQVAQADAFAVTNTNNSGPGSLRQAITDANNHPGADIITFSPATNGIPIVLAAPAGEDLNASGDLDILDGGDLAIQGNGPANTIVDGGGVDRVFHVCPGGCTQTVTLTGMTIQNGLVVSGGGGIRNAADTLIVDGSIIRNNIAVNGGGITNLATLIIQNGSVIGGAGAGNQAYNGNGGGVYNYSGSTTLDDSIISANLADNNGGGIWSQATLLIQNGSTIGGAGAGNMASNNGGGVYNYDTGTISVDGSTISDNSAAIDGGGFYNNATLNVQNNSVIGGIGAGNKAKSGGGIFNYSGTATIDGSTLSANSVTVDGGGVYNEGDGVLNEAVLNVQNGSVIGGSGAGNLAPRGGGIFNDTHSTVIVDGSTVSANSATIEGGGIYNYATLSVQNGSIVGTPGAGNTAYQGGGIYSYSGTVTVDSSTISANSASSGGGGIYNRGTLDILNGSTIGGIGAGNSAADGGGLENLSTGTTIVDDSTISANAVVFDGGGVSNLGTLYIRNASTIGGVGAGNTSEHTGGGISNIFDGTVTVDGSTISANAAELGGGVYNAATLIVQNGSTIGGPGAGNTAEAYGGGISNSIDGVTTVNGSRLINNSAATNGGGVHNTNDTVGATSVTGSCIVGNSNMSFNNIQPAKQIATGNWWGAATGPNTPGADSVLGNVNVSGYLTLPILDCAPDLQASKSNDTGGNATVGTPFHWTVNVANTGLIDATFEVGQTILVDDLPAGPTYGAAVVGNIVDVANDSNIHCSLAGDTLTCAAAGGSVTLGAVTGKFDVTFSVTPGAPVTLVNPAGVCMVDPDGNLIEGNESDNNCPVNVVNVTTRTTYVHMPLLLR
jgi:hypothetical protein